MLWAVGGWVWTQPRTGEAGGDGEGARPLHRLAA